MFCLGRNRLSICSDLAAAAGKIPNEDVLHHRPRLQRPLLFMARCRACDGLVHFYRLTPAWHECCGTRQGHCIALRSRTPFDRQQVLQVGMVAGKHIAQRLHDVSAMDLDLCLCFCAQHWLQRSPENHHGPMDVDTNAACHAVRKQGTHEAYYFRNEDTVHVSAGNAINVVHHHHLFQPRPKPVNGPLHCPDAPSGCVDRIMFVSCHESTRPANHQCATPQILATDKHGVRLLQFISVCEAVHANVLPGSCMSVNALQRTLHVKVPSSEMSQ
mmetsp:Transcript_118901/g.236932  ORF Transcript_118901/g.236932 Transcript_118901/m.236932 type:complete len:272 (+) Transcript_118901:297-1112(+)